MPGVLDFVYFPMFLEKTQGVGCCIRRFAQVREVFFFHRFSLNTFLDVFWSDKIILVFWEGFET